MSFEPNENIIKMLYYRNVVQLHVLLILQTKQIKTSVEKLCQKYQN